MAILKTQIGESLTSDFTENTWTFEMHKSFEVTAGKFVIIPEENFEILQNLMRTQNGLNLWHTHPDMPGYKNLIDKLAKCNEILMLDDDGN